jgi:ATP-dependent helicase/nuclease subunit B
VTQENAYFQYLTGMGKSFEYNQAARHNFNILYASLGDELKSRVDLLAETYIDTFKPPIDFFFDPIENNFAVSVSQLESYFRCPHLHYLRYGADIKERETADLKYVDVGNIVHKSLELYFSRTIGRLRDSTQEGVQFLAATAKSAVKEAIATGLKRDVEENVGKANLIYRLECECLKAITELTNSVLRSVFDPKYIETSFGFGQVFPAVKIEINEQVFMLRGKIDRIDTYNDKTVVIDYKTGSTSSDLKDVYCGIKIQLFAYLNAIATGGGIPVAAYYIPIRDSYETEKDASYGVIGHVLNYPEMYEDFDKQAYDEACRTKEKTSSPNWPFNVRYKKKAGIVEATSKTSILSESIFNKFIEYSIDVARNGIDEICDGYSQCSPISGGRGHACEMCAYMRICGADGEKNARVKPKLPHCLSNADQDESDKQPQEVIEG